MHDCNLSRGATLNSDCSALKQIRYASPDVGFLCYEHVILPKRFDKGYLNHTNYYFRLFFVIWMSQLFGYMCIGSNIDSKIVRDCRKISLLV